MKHPRLQNSSALSVTKLIRKLRGGSQSSLVLCNDGRHYILKLNDNPQGPNVLANELMGNLLGHAVGLPMGIVRPVLVSDHFLDANCSINFQTGRGECRPSAGLHLACSVIGELAHPDRRLEWIRRSDVPRLANRSDFLGMYLFDFWAMHVDTREAIFLSTAKTKRLHAFFTDNGHLCRGPAWHDQGRKYVACHFERSIYDGLWSEKAVQAWMTRFRIKLPAQINLLSQRIPDNWYTGDLTGVCKSLILRLSNLPDLIDQNIFDQLYTPLTVNPNDAPPQAILANHQS